MKKLKNIFTSLMVLILTLGVINEVKAQTKQGDFRYEQIFFEGNGGTMYHVRKDGLSTEEGYENYGYLLMDEEPVFCIDASTPYESGSTFTGREFRDGEVISEGTGFKITKDVQKKLERIAYYGYQSQKSDKNYVYTQMLIWENIDRVARRFTYPLSIEEYRQFKNDVMSKVNNHSFTPSWNGKKVTLKKGQSITLTNTNTSIGELNIPKSKNGYNFTVNGNKLTITATNSAKNNTIMRFRGKNPEYVGTSFIWKKPGEQNMGSFRMPDPFNGRLTLNIQEFSPLEITKVDELGRAVSGVKFKVWYSDEENSKTYTTGKDGKVKIDNRLVGKTIKIQEISVPNHLELSKEIKSIEIKANTLNKVKFINKIKSSTLNLKKVDEDGNAVPGVKFKIWYTNDISSSKTYTTDSKGLVNIKDLKANREISIQEIEVPNHLILSKEVKKIVLEPEKTGKVEFKNLIKKGNIEILKVSSHDKKIKLEGVEFELLKDGKTIQTKKTGKDGIAVFENVHFGKYQIREKETISGYFKNSTVKDVEVKENKEVIKLLYENEKKPEIKTLAKVNGEKEIFKTGMVSVTDEVIYKDLVPGKEYILKGVLMDKSTNKPLLIEGREIRGEKIFIPDVKDGMVKLEFKFDVSKCETNEIVVFERLYKDGKEIAVHADINDLGQTVKFIEPKIGTKATIDGKKEVEISQKTELIDEVSYKNLIPGKEYILEGVLMDKKTGKALKVHGKEVTSILTFVPEKSDGVVKIKFIFNSSELFGKEVVVFERLYKDGKEIAVHTDINDLGQTVKFKDKPKTPNTGDNNQIIKTGVVLSLSFIGMVLVRLFGRKNSYL